MRDSRKLAMQFNDSRHACSNSFLEAVIVAAMIAFAVCVYVDLILQVAFVPNHSGNSSCAIAVTAVVLAILCLRAMPKIVTSIVEGVSVAVISFSRVSPFKPNNLSVHQYVPTFALGPVSSISVERLSTWIPQRGPVPLHEPFVVSGIDDSDLALSKRDEFDRLVLRLDNRFAFDAILGHDLTSNEIAVFDRISIVAGRL